MGISYIKYLPWLFITFVCWSASAVLFTLNIDGLLPPQAALYRGDLYQGLRFSGAMFLFAGFLSLVSALFWWPGESRGGTASVVKGPILPVILGLILVGSLSRFPTITSAFTWDELNMLISQIHRGYAVIFTFVGNSQTHFLTGALALFTTDLFGESELTVRLPMCLLGILTPPVIYWGVLRESGPRAALWAAGLAVVHSTLVIISPSARGYIGNVFCSAMSGFLFVRVVRGCGWWLRSALILCHVIGCGFVITYLVVPVSQGALAGCIWLAQVIRNGKRDLFRSGYCHAVFSSLWAVVIALAVYGVAMPQFINMTIVSRSPVFTIEQTQLSFALLKSIAGYLTGTRSGMAAAVFLLMSAGGWFAYRGAMEFRIAFLAPVLLSALWLLVPGAVFFARLFAFVIPAVVIGVALLVQSVSTRPRNPITWLIYVTLALWLVSASSIYRDHFTIRHPDLKGLAGRLEGHPVALCGQQADVNAYYFPKATVCRFTSSNRFASRFFPKDETEWGMMSNVEYIVYGSSPDCFWDEPVIINKGFAVRETLPSWKYGEPWFRVYQRSGVTLPVGNSRAGE